MKKFIVLFIIFIFFSNINLVNAQNLTTESNIWKFSETSKSDYIILSAFQTNSKNNFWGKGRVYTVVPKSYKKLIFIFHGYLINRDPYLQRPQYIIEKMNLKKYAEELEALIVIPQMNDTVYEKEYLQTSLKWDNNGNIAGGKWANEVLPQYIVKKYFNNNQPPMYAIGISTGAQGAIKFGIQNSKYIKKVIGISGTYSLLNLPKDDGEYIIHDLIFGDRDKNLKIWKQEDIFKNIKKITFPLYLYSESNSVLTNQTKKILEYSKKHKRNNISGSYSIIAQSEHNWIFWSNPKLLNLVFSHIKN